MLPLYGITVHDNKGPYEHVLRAEATVAGLHDDDLAEKAEAERLGKPTTIDGFKCDSHNLSVDPGFTWKHLHPWALSLT